MSLRALIPSKLVWPELTATFFSSCLHCPDDLSCMIMVRNRRLDHIIFWLYQYFMLFINLFCSLHTLSYYSGSRWKTQISLTRHPLLAEQHVCGSRTELLPPLSLIITVKVVVQMSVTNSRSNRNTPEIKRRIFFFPEGDILQPCWCEPAAELCKNVWRWKRHLESKYWDGWWGALQRAQLWRRQSNQGECPLAVFQPLH